MYQAVNNACVSLEDRVVSWPAFLLSRLWQAQQERFAIDSHGEPTDSAKFRAALKALKDHREHM